MGLATLKKKRSVHSVLKEIRVYYWINPVESDQQRVSNNEEVYLYSSHESVQFL